MQIPVCIHADREEARVALRQRFDGHLRGDHYVSMLEASGFPEAREGRWPERMLDATALYGTEHQVADGLGLLQQAGVGELLITPVGAGDSPEKGAAAVLQLVASLSR